MQRKYSQKDNLTKDDLLKDFEFYDDAKKFLAEREGKKDLTKPTEVYDAFMEHMRFHNVNEVTTIRDLEYAQNASQEGKLRFANLIDAYDRLDGEVSLTSALDYAEGIATAPSTYLGIISGGTGKAAAYGATQATKMGVRKILAEAAKRSAKAAAVEGAIGVGQGAVQEEVRVETGMQDEIDTNKVVQAGLIAGGTGGLLNLPIQAINVKRSNKANEMLAQAEFSRARKANIAAEKTKETKKNTSKAEFKKATDVLDALPEEKVKAGRRLKQMSSKADSTEVGLTMEVKENIAAAAIRIRNSLNLKKDERITSGIFRAMQDGKITDEVDGVKEILEEHNLSYDEFSLMYLAEISDAGKTLQLQSQAKKAMKADVVAAQKEVEKLISSVDGLNKGGKSGINVDEAKDVIKSTNKAYQVAQDMDKLRLGVMTSQPATTMRNNLNGGFRVAIDATTRTFNNIFNLRNPMDGTFDVAKYMLNPYEATVVQKLFKETFPEQGAKLFREAADIEAAKSGETVLGTIGRKINILNTASDNFFKRAVIAASMRRRVSDSNLPVSDRLKQLMLRNRMSRQMSAEQVDEVLSKASKDDIAKLMDEYGDLNSKKTLQLEDLIETNSLEQMPDEMLKDSIADAYEFVYQAPMTGKNMPSAFARGVIKAHHAAPFLISSFMPFPRFVANQLKFVYEHMPLVGMMHLDRLGAKTAKAPGYYKDRFAKQATGAVMLTAAYNWRLKQGETEHWYQFKDNNGNVIDGRPVYGPFAPFMLLADTIYRYQNDQMPARPTQYYSRAISESLLGSTFRTGLGLYALDKFISDTSSGELEKMGGEFVGNIVNTFLIPASAVRDLYAQFDEDARGIPETRTGEYNFFDVLYRRGTRSMPKNFVGDATEGYAKYFDEAERARSPFQTGELTQVNPLEKQMFGLSKRKAKNVLQNEMGRLNLTPYDLYKRDPNDQLDFYMCQELSKKGSPYNLNEVMEGVIKSERYQSMNIDEKRELLDDRAKGLITTVRNAARERIEREAGSTDAKYTSIDRMSWEKMDRLTKNRIDREYKEDFGGTSVSEDRDKTITLPDGTRMNVLQWAIFRSKSKAE